MQTTVNGNTVNYEIAGAGPWLTLSHSLACGLHMWDEQMDALTKKYKVLRYDTRGHGQSSVPAKGYDMERLGRDVLAKAIKGTQVRLTVSRQEGCSECGGSGRHVYS